MLARCFVVDYCDLQTNLSYRFTCLKTCPKSNIRNIQNIDLWAPDDSGVILDYLKLYAVFNSTIK